MSGLRQFVAEAIRAQQESGGLGILRDEECTALHDASWALEQRRRAEGDMTEDQIKEERLIFYGITVDLGPHPIFIHGAPRRIDAYWLKCADCAIDAYDQWLKERTTAPLAGDGDQKQTKGNNQ